MREAVEFMAIYTGPSKLVTRLTSITISGQPGNGTPVQWEKYSTQG